MRRDHGAEWKLLSLHELRINERVQLVESQNQTEKESPAIAGLSFFVAEAVFVLTVTMQDGYKANGNCKFVIIV